MTENNKPRYQTKFFEETLQDIANMLKTYFVQHTLVYYGTINKFKQDISDILNPVNQPNYFDEEIDLICLSEHYDKLNILLEKLDKTYSFPKDILEEFIENHPLKAIEEGLSQQYNIRTICYIKNQNIRKFYLPKNLQTAQLFWDEYIRKSNLLKDIMA